MTDTPGHFNGKCTFVPEILYPDKYTVVDVYENSDGVYKWPDYKIPVWRSWVELGLLESTGTVGRMLLVRHNIIIYFWNVMKAARARGLGFYMDSGNKVFVVEHNNCTYLNLIQDLE